MIRLFMSTDVAGSTLFKASSAHQGAAGWLDVFHAFFANYPIMVMGQVGLEFLSEDALPEVAVWKFMGDEAIFTCKPSSPEEVTLLVRAHFNAMAAYEQEYLADLPLRLKGSAWLASFPSPNIEVEVPELAKDGRTTPTDFIGPDIDLGFRIGKFAHPSTVSVSLDLLDTVLRATNRELLDFYLVGREELKGVLFGRPYPVIWARPADAPSGFMPWEIEDSRMIAKAVADGPTPPALLQETIDGVRLYLRKMHGAQRTPISFDDEVVPCPQQQRMDQRQLVS
jgi:hypothetical protein